MKKNHITKLILSSFFIMIFGCGTETNEEKISNSIKEGEEAKYKKEYSDPIEYNDAIVGLQMKVAIILLEIEEHQGDFSGITQLNENLKKTCQEILSIIEEISFTGGYDYGLKENFTNQLHNWECCYMTIRQMEILEELYSVDTTNTEDMIDYQKNMTEFIEILEKQFVIEENLNNAILESQKEFAKAYDTKIEEGHPLDEKWDEVNKENEEFFEDIN